MVTKKKASKIINLKTISFLTFAFGVMYLVLGLYSKYQNFILVNADFRVSSNTETRTYSFPSQLKIEKADINLAIDPFKITDGIWAVSESNASFLETSAKPGQGGNIVIYGHNKKNIFGNLIGNNLVGSTVLITTKDESTHGYIINEVKTVAPNDVSIIEPTDHEVLTIFTCTGVLDSKRLVIKAEPSDINKI